MSQLELFSPGALQPFVKCLVARNIPAEHYLERHLIPPERVASGSGKVLKQQVYGFFDDVVRREGLESLGFLDGDPYPLSELGPLGSALHQAVTLQDAISTFSGLLPMLVDGNTITLVYGAQLSWLCCQTKDLPRTARIPDHTSVLVLREVIRLAAGSSWQPDQIKFYTDPAPVIETFPELASCDLAFLQEVTAVSFPTDLLHRPLRVNSNLKDQYTGLHATDPSPATTGAKLQALLETLQDFQRLPSIDEVAETLGTSRTTLFRMLAREGTNYRQLTERVRFKAAVRLLEDPANSIKEIAYALGYSYPGNFNRSFLRVSGVTPAVFREKMLPDS